MAPKMRGRGNQKAKMTPAVPQKSGGASLQREQLPRKRVVSFLPASMKTRAASQSREPSIRPCRVAPVREVGASKVVGVEGHVAALMDTMTSAKLAEIHSFIGQEMSTIGNNLSSALDNLLRTELVDFKRGVLSQLHSLVAAQVAAEVTEIREEAAAFQENLTTNMEARVKEIKEHFTLQIAQKPSECLVRSGDVGGDDSRVQDEVAAVESITVAEGCQEITQGGTDESRALLQTIPRGRLPAVDENRSQINRKEAPVTRALSRQALETGTRKEEAERVTRKSGSRRSAPADLKRLGCVKEGERDENVAARWCLPGVFTRSMSLAIGAHKRAKVASSSRQEGAKILGERREPLADISAGGGDVGDVGDVGEGRPGNGEGRDEGHVLGAGPEETAIPSPVELLCEEAALPGSPAIQFASTSPPVPHAQKGTKEERDSLPAPFASHPEASGKLPRPPLPLAVGEGIPVPEAPTKERRPARAEDGITDASGAEAAVGEQGPGGGAQLGGVVKLHLDSVHFGTTCQPSPYMPSSEGGMGVGGVSESFRKSESWEVSLESAPRPDRRSEGLFPCLCRFCSPTFQEGGEEVECSANDTAFRPRVIGSRICPAACFVDGGQGVLLAAEDGSCTYYDAVSWKERVHYCPPPGVALGPVGGCWLVSAPWLNTDSTPLVVVSSTRLPSFCSWHFHTGQVAGHSGTATCHADAPAGAPTGSCRKPSEGCGCASCRKSGRATWRDAEAPTWWSVPSGALLCQGRVGRARVGLTDLRDGASAGEAQLGTPLAQLRHNSPLQWADKKRLMVAEKGGVGLWEVKGGGMRLAKFVELPYGESVTALVTKGAPDANHRPRTTFDGAFCTERAVYVLDWKTPSALHLKIPYNETRPADCLHMSDWQILAGVGGEPYEEHTRILEWECRGGEAIGDFLLEKRTVGAAKGPVTQVWAGNGKVLGVHGGGLYIFQESPTYGQRPDNDARLLAVVGRGLKGGLLNPRFYGDGDRVLLLSANHEPRMYTGV